MVGIAVVICFLVGILAPPVRSATVDESIPHLRKQGNATQLIVDGKPFVMLAGELTNSTASSLDYMEPVWDKLVALCLNTALAALSWEMVEPEEGKFDFALVDGLIKGAREHNLKLVFLWFGSWKNGVSSYIPPWVKKDTKRFARVGRKDGRINYGVVTPLSDEAGAADARAFAAVMRRIREIDARRHTVLMMQVENEVGTLGQSRDFAELAEATFAKPVPAELMNYLQKHKDSLLPETLKVWESGNFRTSGAWAEVFGNDAWADEVFMAWHMGRYIGKIAEAGKKEYPIPMYANAWLVQNEKQKPGDYPSGGPVSRMMDIWRAAAPAIDLLAPDIYLPDFKGVCESYARSGNPLMIPEVSRGPEAAARVFWAVAQMNAMCFAPYAIESCDTTHPIAKSYRVLTDLMPLITERQGTGRLIGFLEDQGDKEKTFDLASDYRAHIMFGMGGKREGQRGYGLAMELRPDEFLLAGNGFGARFNSKSGGQTDILEIWEMVFKDGRWVTRRRMNGDESAGGWRAQLPSNYADRYADVNAPWVLRVKVFTHKKE
jgi:hypothetical protein